MSFLLMSKKSPGVYVHEVASGSAPISGVGTGTAAVLLERADLGGKPGPAADVPALVTNLSEFRAWAGEDAPGAWVAALSGFFVNGGERCHVVAWADLPAALAALQTRDDVAIVAAPGLADTDLARAVIDHCTLMADRVAILDGATTTPDLPASPFAAYYYPRIVVADPAAAGHTLTLGPAAHLAGAWARVDATRGVHKAPANLDLLGATDVAVHVTRAEQDGFNHRGVNALRKTEGSVRITGARTLAGDESEFKFINVQRTLLYLARSIDRGLQWVVFEPNTTALWGRVVRNVNAFLHEAWAGGALFGATPEEAWYVRCDAAQNPPETRAQGQLNVEIGVALARPAEFVVVNLTQWSGPKA